MSDEIYDSAVGSSYLGDLATLWRCRGLIVLLSRNNFFMRYHRSVLGVGWSLLNPLLEMLVYYVIFSHLFRFHTGAAPYISYVLSGLVIANFVTNVVTAVSASAASNASLVTRLRVPAEVFGFGQTGELLISALVSLVPLLVILIVVGPGLAIGDLVVIPVLALLALLATGAGLLLSPLVALFRDTIQITQILLTLVTYLAPVFYPFSIIPARFRIVEQLNPLYWYLDAVRAGLFGGSAGSVTDWAVMVGAAAAALIGGTYVCSRARGTTLAALT